jgi:hypothetical protein
MEFGAEVHHQTPFFVGLNAHNSFILGIIQQLTEFLEAILFPIELRLLLFDPRYEIVCESAAIHFDSVRLEDVAQHR